MPNNPLTINPLDENKFSLEFSKESFTEFFFSLLATPRQERRIYRTGFDLRIDDTKLVLEKIAHKIQTDHDILHNEFTADVLFNDETRLTFNSTEQFFTTSDVRNDEIKQLSITLSVVIPFNRSKDEKSFEKQTIFLLVKAGQIGTVEVDIRSTEISWAAGYFNIVDEHFQKLTRAIHSHRSTALDKLFFLYPMFLSDFIDDAVVEELYLYSSRVNNILSRFLLGTISIFMVFLILLFDQTSEATVYNPEISKIEKTDIALLISEVGWENAASMVRNTQTLSKLDGVEYAEGDAPKSLLASFSGFFLNPIFIVISAGSFLIIFSNYCYARAVASDKIGRIFLYNDNLPLRPKGNYAIGIFGSLLAGVFSSALASGALAMFGYF